jgi:hypothetical protein
MSTEVNFENRARALVKLAGLYRIDPASPYLGDRTVDEYVEHPESIRPYVAVIEYPGDRDWDGTVLVQSVHELRPRFESWQELEEAWELEYELDREFGPWIVAAVDLDAWMTRSSFAPKESFHALRG